jgi:hypothetical protein
MDPAGICTLCNLPMTAPGDHRLSPADAKPLGLKRCRMCGKGGAWVRCVLAPGEFWVECPEGHLTRTTA